MVMENKNMLKELEVVELTHNFNKKNLKAGERGTIVGIYKNGEAYEVEFVNPDGGTKALLTLVPNDIRSVVIEANVNFDASFAVNNVYASIVETGIDNCLYKNLDFETETKKSKENTEKFHFHYQ